MVFAVKSEWVNLACLITTSNVSRIDLSQVATEYVAAERRKQDVIEAFKSVEHVMTHLMSDKGGIAHYLKSKRAW